MIFDGNIHLVHVTFALNIQSITLNYTQLHWLHSIPAFFEIDTKHLLLFDKIGL